MATKIASGGAPAPLGGAAGGSPPPAPWKLADRRLETTRDRPVVMDFMGISWGISMVYISLYMFTWRCPKMVGYSDTPF